VGVKRRPPPDLDLHIERLVVRLPVAGRERIAPALEAELARLFAEHGAPPGLGRDGSALHMPGGIFRVPRGAKAEAIGTEIARRLHAAWNGGEGGGGGGGEGEAGA
jgi:hypothetical protein